MLWSHLWTKLRRRLVLLIALAVPLPAFGQVLVVEPDCGIVGAPFLITGSGWAEPVPVCEYVFFFDGTEFTPRQPDGLFGPPNKKHDSGLSQDS